MGSGGRRMVINSFERAVSTDINRLQAFRLQDQNEALRYWLNVSAATDDFDAGSADTEFNTTGTPTVGEIMNGLLVQPQLASLNLLVSPGVAFIIDPDAVPSTDDSVYKMVHDAGVTSLGALAMTSNSSGSTRIDVIECQRTDATVETDNRDIFNPTTGLFSATTVTKGLQGEFTYRVRLGTPGSGYPGAAAGWMILAIASVPNGTTTNDTITFWDVRPLVNDRIFGSVNLALTSPRKRRSMGKLVLPNGTNSFLTGTYEWEVSGRRLGGLIRRGTPGTDALNLDLNDSANQDPSYTPSTTALSYLYLLTPFGLPRWARYTDAVSGSRKPRSPRGIPVVTSTAPNVDGTPSAAVNLPSSCGFGSVSTTAGACILATPSASSQTGINGVDDGRVYTFGNSSTGSAFSLPASSISAGAVIWNGPFATQNPTPPHAKALWVAALILEGTALGSATNKANEPIYFQVIDNSGAVVAAVPCMPQWASNATGAGVDVEWGVQARVPVPRDFPTLTLASWQLKLVYSSYGGAAASASLLCTAWEL